MEGSAGRFGTRQSRGRRARLLRPRREAPSALSVLHTAALLPWSWGVSEVIPQRSRRDVDSSALIVALVDPLFSSDRRQHTHAHTRTPWPAGRYESWAQKSENAVATTNMGAVLLYMRLDMQHAYNAFRGHYRRSLDPAPRTMDAKSFGDEPSRRTNKCPLHSPKPGPRRATTGASGSLWYSPPAGFTFGENRGHWRYQTWRLISPRRPTISTIMGRVWTGRFRQGCPSSLSTAPITGGDKKPHRFGNAQSSSWMGGVYTNLEGSKSISMECHIKV